jgi:ssDNA-binding Zn-finger/Zn-ribbon topoisomerase 1
MSKRAFALKKTDGVAKCPKCGNNEKFIGISEQVAEDGCEIWVECYVCNYDPFNESVGSRIDSVMGSLDDGNLLMAVSEWTSIIESGD